MKKKWKKYSISQTVQMRRNGIYGFVDWLVSKFKRVPQKTFPAEITVSCFATAPVEIALFEATTNIRRNKMKPMKLILDFTARAKEQQREREEADYLVFPYIEETIMTLYYDDGSKEHFATTETHPNVRQGRRAAKRALRRHSFTFQDRTK